MGKRGTSASKTFSTALACSGRESPVDVQKETHPQDDKLSVHPSLTSLTHIEPKIKKERESCALYGGHLFMSAAMAQKSVILPVPHGQTYSVYVPGIAASYV